MPMEDPMDPADIPGVKIDGPPRRHVEPQFVTAVDDKGVVHKLNRDNARDWATRPGHAIVGPWRDEKLEVRKTDEEIAPAPEQPGVVVSDPKPAAEVLEPLEELRREAAALGIDVDQRWGKKRLTTEIKQAKEGQG